MKVKYVVLLCVICSVVCFFAGRKTVSYDTEIRYVHGDAVRDTIPFPVPYLEIIHDTIYLKGDTVQTLIDWNTERYYTERLLNDNRGLLDVSAIVQFNTLRDLSYSFTPIYKEITMYKSPVWQPYIGVSYNTFNHFQISGGLFRKHIGIELQYITDFNRNGYGIGFKYFF